MRARAVAGDLSMAGDGIAARKPRPSRERSVTRATARAKLWSAERSPAPPSPLPRRPTMADWQPIDTAPEDGTWIIGRGADGSEHRISWGRNRHGALCWFTAGGYFLDSFTHWKPEQASAARKGVGVGT